MQKSASSDPKSPQRLKKPNNARTRRYLKQHEPKQAEDVKQALLICGHQFSATGKNALSDLHRLKQMECVMMGKKHVGLAPFEEGGEVLLEKLSRQYDCGLFVVANHTKSKPDNLVFGRLFDHRIYDMIELGMESFHSIQSFTTRAALVQGTKPCFVFLGEKFETDEKLKLAKSVFLDFFRGTEATGVRFEGLQRLIVITAVSSQRLLFRHFHIAPRKQASPNSSLEDFVEVGPRFDFVVRRTREAPEEMRKEAMKKSHSKKKEKNVQLDSLENKVGAVYVPHQEINKVVTARHKGFKRARRESRETRKRSRKSDVMTDA